jgi:hypothetical protein
LNGPNLFLVYLRFLSILFLFFRIPIISSFIPNNSNLSNLLIHLFLPPHSLNNLNGPNLFLGYLLFLSILFLLFSIPNHFIIHSK